MIYLEQFKQLFISTEFVIYVLIMVTDIITGNIKALIKNEWNSNNGVKGLLKHFSVTTFAIFVLSSFTIYYDTPTYQTTVLIFLSGINLMSILENLDQIGVKFPDKMTKYFSQMTYKGENKNE